MLQNITQSLDYVLESEGPEVNRSESEPGGISKYGVSLEAYADYCKSIGAPKPTADDIASLTDPQARIFYVAAFANRIRFNDLPSGIDYRLLDLEVNLGVSGGIKLLHEVLYGAVSGDAMPRIVSDADIAKVNSIQVMELVQALGNAWLDNKKKDVDWPKYGVGWTNRDDRVTLQALNIAIPTV